MNTGSNSTNQRGVNLPAPISPELAPQLQPEKLVVNQGTERNPELLPLPQASPQQPAQEPPKTTQNDASSTPIVSDPPTQLTSTSSSPSTTPAMADDLDLIEKEWVIKAKEIVSKTRDDPHKQNEEISAVKADYIKKRYNKEVPKNE